MVQDKQREIAHAKTIGESAEFFWGWDTPAGRSRAERRARMIIDEVRSRNFSDILEIGSGTGVFTKEFCDAGLDVKGIDISEDLLAKARAKCSGAANLDLRVADVEHMPFDDGSFDAVAGVCVLHHLHVIPALKEIRRVLKKGGIILFSEPNMMNPQLMLQKNIKPIKQLKILGETEDETAFFKWQMRNILKDIGFKDIRIRPFDFLHPWTPSQLIPSIQKLGSFLENLPLLKEIAGSLFISAVK